MARNPGRTVYIGNFDEKIPERVLYEILIQAGRVVDLHIPCDKESNRPRGYAFAEYETEEIAQYAVRLFSGLVRLNGKLLKFMIAGHDKPTSNGNQPVTPKLNPVPLPKQSRFVHPCDKTLSHTTAYPVVNGRIPGYGPPPNHNPYGVHAQAFSGGPVDSHSQLSNDMYAYSLHAFGSALNAGCRGPVQNVLAHGAAQQPIMMYSSYQLGRFHVPSR